MKKMVNISVRDKARFGATSLSMGVDADPGDKGDQSRYGHVVFDHVPRKMRDVDRHEGNGQDTEHYRAYRDPSILYIGMGFPEICLFVWPFFKKRLGGCQSRTS